MTSVDTRSLNAHASWVGHAAPRPYHPRGEHMPLRALPEHVAAALVVTEREDAYCSVDGLDASEDGSSCGAQRVREPLPPITDVVPENMDFGFPRTLRANWERCQLIGKGGYGVVTVVRCRVTGEQFACKSIPKVPDPHATTKKKEQHLRAVLREVNAMRMLSGSLNVAALEAVYEDDAAVHLVMEWCTGGPLLERPANGHYSERTVASYLRAALRTIAQCHAHRLLHRDIKPANFMLASANEKAPLKAIDFGLATPFPDFDTPLNLGLEGTPWYMAPETLRGEWLPASDLWAAGVMAVQLLTGYLPFDDHACPSRPAVSKVWKSILNDPLRTERPEWDGISDEAKDFVRLLLNRNAKERPTAKQALEHPFLRGDVHDRKRGKKLNFNVVRRLQRYGASSALRRTVLESIAHELLATADASSVEKICQMDPAAGDSIRPVLSSACGSAMHAVLGAMQLRERELAPTDAVTDGLGKLGYRLEPRDACRLVNAVDLGKTGHVARATLVASQIDWGALQENERERWLELVRSAFDEMDADGDGFIATDDIIEHLRARLPPDEIGPALAKAYKEANRGMETVDDADAEPTDGLDFTMFKRMLSMGSMDSLDLYDDRSSAASTAEEGSFAGQRLALQALLERSLHAADTPLGTVPEDGAPSEGGAGCSTHGALDATVHSNGSMQGSFRGRLKKVASNKLLSMWLGALGSEKLATPDASVRSGGAGLFSPEPTMRKSGSLQGALNQLNESLHGRGATPFALSAWQRATSGSTAPSPQGLGAKSGSFHHIPADITPQGNSPCDAAHGHMWPCPATDPSATTCDAPFPERCHELPAAPPADTAATRTAPRNSAAAAAPAGTAPRSSSVAALPLSGVPALSLLRNGSGRAGCSAQSPLTCAALSTPAVVVSHRSEGPPIPHAGAGELAALVAAVAANRRASGRIAAADGGGNDSRTADSRTRGGGGAAARELAAAAGGAYKPKPARARQASLNCERPLRF